MIPRERAGWSTDIKTYQLQMPSRTNISLHLFLPSLLYLAKQVSVVNPAQIRDSPQVFTFAWAMPPTEDVLLHPSLHPYIPSFIHLFVRSPILPSTSIFLFYLFPSHPCRPTSSRKASLMLSWSVPLDSPHFCWFLIVYNIQLTIKLYIGLGFPVDHFSGVSLVISTRL